MNVTQPPFDDEIQNIPSSSSPPEPDSAALIPSGESDAVVPSPVETFATEEGIQYQLYTDGRQAIVKLPERLWNLAEAYKHFTRMRKPVTAYPMDGNGYCPDYFEFLSGWLATQPLTGSTQAYFVFVKGKKKLWQVNKEELNMIVDGAERLQQSLDNAYESLHPLVNKLAHFIIDKDHCCQKYLKD